MTQNQVSFAKVKEEQRHNKATEKLNKQQNKITQEHYSKQDDYTAAHYERSDKASMISANASALNAQASASNAATNKKKYEMEYDIEYNWNQQPLTVSYIDPKTGESSPWEWSEDKGYTNSGTIVYNYPAGMPMSAQLKDTQIMTALYETLNTPRKLDVEYAQNVSKTLQSGSSAVNNVFNALYGKQGLLGALQSVISEGE